MVLPLASGDFTPRGRRRGVEAPTGDGWPSVNFRFTATGLASAEFLRRVVNPLPYRPRSYRRASRQRRSELHSLESATAPAARFFPTRIREELRSDRAPPCDKRTSRDACSKLDE